MPSKLPHRQNFFLLLLPFQEICFREGWRQGSRRKKSGGSGRDWGGDAHPGMWELGSNRQLRSEVHHIKRGMGSFLAPLMKKNFLWRGVTKLFSCPTAGSRNFRVNSMSIGEAQSRKGASLCGLGSKPGLHTCFHHSDTSSHGIPSHHLWGHRACLFPPLGSI